MPINSLLAIIMASTSETPIRYPPFAYISVGFSLEQTILRTPPPTYPHTHTPTHQEEGCLCPALGRSGCVCSWSRPWAVPAGAYLGNLQQTVTQLQALDKSLPRLAQASSGFSPTSQGPRGCGKLLCRFSQGAQGGAGAERCGDSFSPCLTLFLLP